LVKRSSLHKNGSKTPCFAAILRSIGSMAVEQQQMGQYLGAMSVMETASGLVAPLIFNAVYSSSVGGFTGLVYIVAAAFPLFGCAMTLCCVPEDDDVRRNSRALVAPRLSMIL
jgi:hypothetical protein